MSTQYIIRQVVNVIGLLAAVFLIVKHANTTWLMLGILLAAITIARMTGLIKYREMSKQEFLASFSIYVIAIKHPLTGSPGFQTDPLY